MTVDLATTGTAVIVGLDLALRHTGWAVLSPTGATVDSIDPTATGVERLAALGETVAGRLNDTGADLVVLEGPAFGRHQGAHALGEAHGVVKLAVRATGVPLATVAPTVVKRFATGRGNASKAEVLTSAVRRLGYSGSSTDEADALWLALIGKHLVDGPVNLPATHLKLPAIKINTWRK